RRMLTSQNAEETPSYLIEDMTEDVIERLSFLRLDPVRALVIGDYSGKLADALRSRDCTVVEAEPALGFDEEAPLPQSGFDLVASLGTLDTVNDLPGALIHIRNALAPGGLMIASFCGAGCVPKLREAMLAADDERPSPRIHPMVDVRAGGQLLQRAGFADPVIDSRHMDVSFPSLDRLVGDLRAQGLSNVLADPGPPLSRDALERARKAFVHAGDSGRTIERFEILTLSGWRR
ncbi:MAG: methyltransferase domain-containing protein, partial [Hyphomicrobiaceae bacterium]